MPGARRLRLHVLDAGDLVADTHAAFAEARRSLGSLSGGLLFECLLRKQELDKRGHEGAPAWGKAQGLQTAGFYTYGESYLTHMTQTLTALLFA